jgi:hypothetical protein
VLSLTTDDCHGEAERLKAKGLVFVKEPYRMEYGGIDTERTRRVPASLRPGRAIAGTARLLHRRCPRPLARTEQ